MDDSVAYTENSISFAARATASRTKSVLHTVEAPAGSSPAEGGRRMQGIGRLVIQLRRFPNPNRCMQTGAQPSVQAHRCTVHAAARGLPCRSRACATGLLSCRREGLATAGEIWGWRRIQGKDLYGIQKENSDKGGLLIFRARSHMRFY